MKKENEVKEVKNEVVKPRKYDVVDPFESLFNDDWVMPTLFRNPWRNFERSFRAMEKNMPKANMVEKDDHYELTLEVPGFKKEDIDIIVDGDVISVVANHEENNDEEKDGKKVLHERSSSSMSRSFSFPGITKEDVKAKLNDGILELTIAKKEEPKKELDKVEIE